jgi:hypothetical protein
MLAKITRRSECVIRRHGDHGADKERQMNRRPATLLPSIFLLPLLSVFLRASVVKNLLAKTRNRGISMKTRVFGHTSDTGVLCNFILSG